jgi:putative phage-type endonuclease
MKIISGLIQGSNDWHNHRAGYFNASDAPAMMGISKYKTRNQFLQEKATGISQDHDDATLARFADGHRFEALARQVAEDLIGEDLSPVTGINGNKSASFDGITFDSSVWTEHKSLNNELRKILSMEGVKGSDLPKEYQVQMEHQAIVCEGKKCLFMASKWDDNDNLIEELHCWYVPDMALREEILGAWHQFELDIEKYTPSNIVEMPRAEVVVDLPALFIHAKGEVTASNMKEYGTALAARLVETRAIVLVTDQDFSNAKESAKVLRDQAKKVIAAQEAMLSQTASIGEVSLMLDAWAKDLNTTALDLENRVKKEDLLKKAAMIDKAKVYCQESFAQAEAGISPIRIILTQSPDFANAIKGKSKFESMQNGIDSVVAEFEIMIRSKVSDVLLKQAFMETIIGFDFLFADMQSIIWKPIDDFKLLVTRRTKKPNLPSAPPNAKQCARKKKPRQQKKRGRNWRRNSLEFSMKSKRQKLKRNAKQRPKLLNWRMTLTWPRLLKNAGRLKPPSM